MTIHNLNARFVETAPAGKHCDGGSLWLYVRNGGQSRAYVFRYTSPVTGAKREMGLGSAKTISLAEVREKAREQHRLLDAGQDPMDVAKHKQLERDAKTGRALLVNDVLDEYYKKRIEHKSLNYRKSAARFLGRIRDTIGTMPVSMVTPRVILDKTGLSEMWDEQRPSAIQLHSHLKRVFSLAMIRCELPKNPAAWTDNLQHMLSDEKHKVEHHATLPYEEVGRFMAAVRRYEDRSARKTGRTNVSLWLEFVVLTGVRVSEVRLAQWKEFDLAELVWNVPPEHRKTGYITGKVRPIPITKPMLAVLEEMQRRTDPSPDALAFPSPYGNQPFAVGTIARFIRLALKWPTEVDAHGFRTTLNGWRIANNNYPKELMDMQLDHLPEGKVDQAYTPDALHQRRKMMEAWGEYCGRSEPEPAADNVVPLPLRKVR